MKAIFARATVLCCALPAIASGQIDSVAQLEDIVVTSSRLEQSRAAAIGDVTVVSKQELESSPSRSLAEILARHAGIDFADSGGPQTPTSVFLRGANANQTLVLINGVRINSATSGAINWNAMDVSTIERVEILRGAASSLYGSDAIGGVVNIITDTRKSERPLSAYGNIGLGSRSTFKSSTGLSGAQDGWDYSVSASLADSDGFSAMHAPAHPDRDGYGQTSVAASLGYQWRDGQHLGVSAYNSYVRAEVDGFDPTLEPVWSLTRQQVYSLTSTNDITTNWQSVMRLGFSKDAAESRERNASTRFGSLQRSYSWQNNFTLRKDHTLSLLLERLEERSQGSPLYAGHARDTNSAGLIYRARMGRHHLQASARNDSISRFGSRATGSLAWDINLTRNWQIGLAGSTGFKAPTFNDLYFPLSPPWFDYAGNPDLEPEKSRNIEAHLRYDKEDYWFSVTAYQNKVRKLINPYVCQEYSGPFCTFGRPENTDSATLRGVSVSGGATLGDTSIRVRADLQNPRDDGTGHQLSRRAKQIYGADLEHRLQDWTLGAEYRFVGKRFDDPANQFALGGYSLWNLTARYDFNKHFSVQARWNNVLNKDYTLVRGYNTEGSSVFINLSWRM